MNSQTLLELRQKDATNVANNGDYTVDLAVPIVVENGDVLSLNSAFIDTVNTSSDFIELDNDLDVTFHLGYYMTNQNSSITRHYAKRVDEGGNSLTDADLTDGKKYILCHRKSTGDLSDYLYYTNIEVINETYPYTDLGGLIHYKYENMDGEKINDFVSISSSKQPRDKVLVALNIIAKKDTFEIINISGISEYKFKAYVPAPYVPTEQQFEIVNNAFNFTIPAGIYTRPQIAKIINDECSINNITDDYVTSSPVQNNFLRTSTKYKTATPNYNTSKYFFVDLEEHDNMFSIPNGYYIGTNQIDFEYDSIQQKFYVNYLHFPLYDSTGKLEVSYVGNKLVDSTKTEYRAVGSYSGVFITSILTTMNGETYDFFSADLGFDLDNELIVNIENTKKVNTSIGNNANSGYVLTGDFPTIKLEEGKHITEAYLGLDIAVQKNANYFQVPSLPLSSTTTTTQQIYASRSISLAGAKTPYFLIDVNLPLPNDLITRTSNKRNVYAIVSKYYSLDSYTSKEGSTILYQHRGMPLSINSISIRILNPDYTVSDNIGDDNTCFIELRKAIQQTQ